MACVMSRLSALSFFFINHRSHFQMSVLDKAGSSRVCPVPSAMSRKPGQPRVSTVWNKGGAGPGGLRVSPRKVGEGSPAVGALSVLPASPQLPQFTGPAAVTHRRAGLTQQTFTSQSGG